MQTKKSSMLSVEQILKTPGLEGIQILTGKSGLWKQVRTVTIVDAPDAANYIQGGEIILSTLYIWKEKPEELANFIEQVARNGSVAMGIKLKRFYNVLPREILELADRIDYPIFSYPQHFSFVDIINPVLSRIVNRQADILYRSMEIHRSLTDLSLETGDTELVISKLSEIILRDVAFIDTFSDRTYVSDRQSPLGKAVEILPLSELVSIYRTEEVNVEGKQYGFILLDANPDPHKTSLLTHNTLMHAKTVLKFKIKRDRLNVQIERKHRDEFILDLLFRNIKSPGEIYSKACLFGWTFNKGGFAIVISLSEKEKKEYYTNEVVKEKVLQLFKGKLSDLYSEVVYTSLTDSLVFIVQSESEYYKSGRQILRKTVMQNRNRLLAETGWDSCCGIGTYVEDLTDIGSSFNNARNALEVALSGVTGKECIIFWDEKCLYHFINAISDSQEGESFYQAFLEPLADYDRKNNAELLQTLFAVTENNWNLKKAAIQMHLHYNTIKYRFSKIKKVLSMDMENEETRLNTLIAVKIWKSKK